MRRTPLQSRTRLQRKTRLRPVSAKKKRDMVFKDGRVRLANKTELRRKAFARSGGFCEEIIRCPLPECNEDGKCWHTFYCHKPITWHTMELSHLKHGPRRDDTLEGVIASCRECHARRHNPKPCPKKVRDGN